MNKLKHSSLPRLLTAFSVLLILASLVSWDSQADKKGLLPTFENLAGRWIGFDCGGRVWRMQLQNNGAGVVAYGTSEGVRSRTIESLDLRREHVDIELEDVGFGKERLVGFAHVKFMRLRRLPARCNIRFQREERVVDELSATERELAIRKIHTARDQDPIHEK